MQSPRSLKYEYELYLEQEIEAYKESLPRSELLALGDAAVERLRTLPQTTLTELVLCDEVDRLIARRLRLPSYRTWRKRYMAQLADMRRPERWGLVPEAPLVRELVASREGEHVLLAGVDDEATVIFPAALGCTVTAVGPVSDALERALATAESAGLGRRVRGCAAELDGWTPDAGLRVVICAERAFSRIAEPGRAEVIDLLQRATVAGGTHFVRAVRNEAGAIRPSAPPSIEALQGWYAGWMTSIDDPYGSAPTFVARKAVASTAY